MSIVVKPNSDGSYSVTCDGTTVKVGGSGSGAIDTAPGPKPLKWPAKPKPNSDGTRASFIVEPFDILRKRPATLRLPYSTPDELAEKIENAFKPLGRELSPSREHWLEANVATLPGQEIDVSILLQTIERLSIRLGVAHIVLRFTEVRLRDR